ncbi:MAG: NAD(P)/FAD-dependent oxidoreductase [Lachnospiraceae bacterium]|nr:NAD(P)/FAD-dependent oxidoreductase [Lachnospiraceae bacterium]MBR1855086.1 NAD(P)/FAD-dependent oxidoreductase [Lachnospiraceae bacterium]
MSEIIVIGGGAAGMMAAIAASERGHHVVLLEKNEKLGKKLFITGKGRCNVTNAADMETLFAHVCTNVKFLYSAFYGFDNRAVMELVEQAGCPLKVERGERVFPISDHSSDVIAALTRILKKNGVEVRLQTEVKELLREETQETDGAKSYVQWHIRGVRLVDGHSFSADAVIVCTGGLSYASTGSTGDGLKFAEETGHRVTECRPSLVPMETAQDWCRELMGLSLKNVELRMVCGGKEYYREQGEMLFTHFGVSGPLALTASCYLGNTQKKANKGKANQAGQTESVYLYIDLKPALSEEQLDKRILRDFDEQKNKQFKNALGGLFPAKLIPVMVRLSGIDGDKKVNEITKEERKSFVQLIKNLPLTVTGTRPFAEAIITQGGVSVKDINPSTMESKRVKGLYFAGEVLDLDAHTGGFNLQIAWSTGHLAGESV